MAVIELTFDDVDALVREIEQNLSRGRTFVIEADGVAVRDACELILRHPETGQGLRLHAEAVWVNPDEPGKGVGLELPPAEPGRLETFVLTGEGDADLVLPPGIEPLPEDDASEAGPPSARDHDTRTIHERVRRLSIREQVLMARGGNLSERIALERCFGPSVWENLLQNPQLTPPEVARIAKKGTISQPLITAIVGNASWLATPEVQRALLANPRLSGTAMTKVLRALPKSELTRVPLQTAYRSQVRDAARKMLKA